MTVTAQLIEQLETIARHLSDEQDLESVVSDPFARDGLAPEALLAIGWLEGCADCANVTVLELLDSCGVSFADYEPPLLQTKTV